MKVNVSFWGSLEVPVRENEVDLEEGMTIAQLLDDIVVSYPKLKDKINFDLVLVNNVYTSSKKNLQSGDNVTIIPPIRC